MAQYNRKQPEPRISQHQRERVSIVSGADVPQVRHADMISSRDREPLLPSCLRRCGRFDLYSLDALRDFSRLLDVEVENALFQVRLNSSILWSKRQGHRTVERTVAALLYVPVLLVLLGFLLFLS
jgi:hypothetical protein